MPELVPIPSPGLPLQYGDAGNPLVVLVHDWYGRLPWLEPYARALASRGLRVVVPDFYDGVATTDSDDARTLMLALDLQKSLTILDDVVDRARFEGSEKVGLVGFSMGGWLALLHAQGGSADAVVAYYSSLGPDDHGVIPAPVYLHFAETDDWDDGEEPQAFIARLKEHGTPVTDRTYIGTKHSFANASLPGKIDANAAALAFGRTASFLESHLVD